MFEKLFTKGGLSLDRLRTLIEVSHAGSIARAAGRDPIRQSQYSRQLKELENFFGVELTQRHGKTLTLTESGARLALLVQENFISLSEFQKDCATEPLHINIGGGDSVLHWVVIPKLGKILSALPRLDVRLHNLRTSEVVDGLSELTLDLGVIREPGASPLHRVRHLGTVHYSIFIPNKLIPKGVKPTPEWALTHLPLAAQSGDGDFRSGLNDQAAKNKIPLRIRIACESFPQAHRALLSGQFGALLPSLLAQDLDRKEYTILESPLLKKLERKICLSWNPRLVRLRNHFEQVIDIFSQHLKF